PPDGLPVHRGLTRDLVEGPGDVALAARRVQGRRDDLVDGATADEVLQGRLAVEDRGALPHVAGESHLRRHRVDLREPLREGPLAAFRGPDPVLPCPEAVDLRPGLVGNLAAVRGLVPPADRRGEAHGLAQHARWSPRAIPG